jgi:pimeloyl-ACP methyl ester carboxylesterase
MTLAFSESGPPSAPTIVFLPGAGAGGWMWRQPVAQLEQDYHCLRPDLPGHGQSQDAGEFSMANAVRAVADLIFTRAHGGTAHLVGLGLGAQVGAGVLAVAARLAQRSLLSGASTQPVLGANLIPPAMRLVAPFKDSDWLVRAALRGLGLPEEYYPEFAADTRRTSALALGRMFRANLNFRVPPGLTRLVTPVLVLVGEHEPRRMRRAARELSAAMLGGQSLLAAGQGHHWPLRAPWLFERVLRAWLREDVLPGELRAVPRG